MSHTGTAALILPGIGNSGPAHWQSLWESTQPSFRRIAVPDWDLPRRAQWVASLDAAVREAGPQVVLVAHSLGCLLVAHWVQSAPVKVRGTLLVAPPDPAGPAFPAEAADFGPVPLLPLPFPSIVVSSQDDPYGSPDFARRVAGTWGSRLVSIGPAGHINAASGLGDWPEGRALLESLLGGPAT